MHFPRLLILTLICSVSAVGRSTPTTVVGAGYLTSAGRAATAVAGALIGRERADSATWSERGTSLYSRRPGAEVRLAAPRGLWLPPSADIPAYEPPPAGAEPPPAPLDTRPRFMGQPDDEILARICNQPVKSVRQLGGGSSISLRMQFADGSQAAVKPNQLRITRYQSEVAAYRVSRALRLGTVPPSCVRSFPRELLMANMPKALVDRMEAEMIGNPRGEVACAVIHWVPHLHGLNLEDAEWWRPLLLRGVPIPSSKQRRVMEISTLLLFDFLILNQDRWSGGNTHEAGGQMVFIDQGAAFGQNYHRRRTRHAMKTLKWSQRFSREAVESLLALDLPPLLGELSDILSPSEASDFADRVERARHYLRTLRHQSPDDSLL